MTWYDFVGTKCSIRQSSRDRLDRIPCSSNNTDCWFSEVLFGTLGLANRRAFREVKHLLSDSMNCLLSGAWCYLLYSGFILQRKSC